MFRRIVGIVLSIFFAALPLVQAAEPLAVPLAATTERAPNNVSWRFDGQGRFPNIHPPHEWSSQRNVLWKTPVEVGGYSSPIVVRDRVFLTAEMGSLICLDLATGKPL